MISYLADRKIRLAAKRKKRRAKVILTLRCGNLIAHCYDGQLVVTSTPPVAGQVKYFMKVKKRLGKAGLARSRPVPLEA